jgi:NADH-quinone oxidoreductase subunit J
MLANVFEWILGSILILSSLGVILLAKPVHACISFLVTLLTLAVIFLELSAEFVGVMQVLVYAGAILVIFMFVIVLFQDAHEQINRYKSKSNPFFILTVAGAFLFSIAVFGYRLIGIAPLPETLPKDFGTAEGLGKVLYVDFFFPFEVVILLFLIALIGSIYCGRKEDVQITKETNK